MRFESNDLKTILDDNNKKKLVLPNFQRSFVWDEHNQRKLLSSFFLGLPIGNILILEGTKDDFAARELCTHETISPREDCSYLLDGQQRVSTLKSIYSDLYPDEPSKWRESWDNIFNRIRRRWFLKVVPENEDVDIFNFEYLNFELQKIKNFEPSMIENLFLCEAIYVKNRKNWFHPAFSPLDRNEKPLSDRLKRNEIVKQATNKGIVPLYEIYGSHRLHVKALHRLVLERMGVIRAKELQHFYSSEPDKMVDILEKVQPEIKDLLEEKNEKEIEHAWTSLHITWANNVASFLEDTLNQEVAEILLPSNEIHRAFAIFEEINRGGTPLDEFDLIVAKAARQRELPPLAKRIVNFITQKKLSLPGSLTDNLIGIKPIELDLANHKIVYDNELTKYFKRQYLNLISIFSHTSYGEIDEIDGKYKLKIKVEHIKREKILDIPYTQINNNTEKTVTALLRAIAFLNVRCGVVGLSDLHYQLMILPISYALANDIFWNSRDQIDQIEYWYWASLFSGAYQFDQNKTAINDISDLYIWLQTGTEKFKNRFDEIFRAQKFSTCEILLCKDEDNPPSSAIQNAILQYILSNQPRDFLAKDIRLSAWEVAEGKDIEYEGKTDNLKIENHHICPLANATKIGQSSKEIRNDKSHILNSPLNRTYISSISNSVIKARTPEDYFTYVSESSKHGHCIPTPIETKFKKGGNETEDDFYERVLSERYEELYKELKKELEKLAAI